MCCVGVGYVQFRKSCFKKNEKRRADRRNENGLINKQQELQDLKIKIEELKQQGLSNRKIATEFNISEGKVWSLLKKQVRRKMFPQYWGALALCLFLLGRQSDLMQRADEMVLRTQQYLNNMYTGNPNWVRVEENGKTGWPTIRGLIRALQIETGISTPNGTFGPATEAACPTLKKDFNPTEKTKRLVCILQGAMWCKGFSPGGLTGTFGDGTEAGVKKFQTSAGLAGAKVNGIADPMIFKALLNMDAYVLVSSGRP